MKRSKFDLSHYKLLSCNMGDLIPVGCQEVLPGDSFVHNTNALIRVSPLLAPVMHPVHVRFHHWFVPNRIIWEDWEKFITGGEDGMDASVAPKIAAPASTGFAVGSLADYLGVPPGVADVPVSALPFRAYALIWNEWYRDEDLQTKLTISKASGTDSTTSTSLKKCAWEKDYFTSARPWTQKGPEVSVPLGSTAPVVSTGNPLKLEGDTSGEEGDVAWDATVELKMKNLTGPLTVNEEMKYFSGLETDLSNATAATINELREAFAVQRFQERMARHGSRYVEYLRSMGVRSSDARMQRPEYLGGGKQVIQFSEVLQTTPTTDGDDLIGVGNLKGHGISAPRSNRYLRFFEEHGLVITLMSVKPKTMYSQGLSRMWSRDTKLDYFQPELQHIGQQAIAKKELYAASYADTTEWGFQDRYDEYRRQESSIAGDFRSSLDFWHYAREFGSLPTLNGSFVECAPTDRVYAVPSEDVLWCMVMHKLKARRVVARTGNSFIY